METFFEHIEAYIDGSLDSETRAKMEEAMKTNASLKNAIDNYPLATSIGESLIELDVLAKLDELDSETDDSNSSELSVEHNVKPSKTKNPNRFLYLAILFALLAAIMYFLSISTENPVEDGVNPIYAMGYQRPIDPDALKSTNSMTTKNDFVLGKKYFGLNEFQKSEKAFVDAINSTKNQDTISRANYWLAHIYMNVENWEAARTALSETDHQNAGDLIKILDRVD